MKTLINGVMLALLSPLIWAADNPKPTLEIGAKVFADRCVLCHGGDGMGEGILPLKLKNYPSTNLAKNNKTQTREEVYEAVVYGGTTGKLSTFMPPMGNELTWTQLESVVNYVLLIRDKPEKALALKHAIAPSIKASRKVGRQLYESRCVLCHGLDGEGNGRLSKIIKTPPPANLQISRLPDEYLIDIIKRGGEAVGRSPKMPPWGEQFNQHEMDSVVLFVKSLRH